MMFVMCVLGSAGAQGLRYLGGEHHNRDVAGAWKCMEEWLADCSEV